MKEDTDLYKRNLCKKCLPPQRVKKEIKEEADEFDDILKQSTGSSLASKIGNSPDKIAKAKRKSKDGMKQTKLAFSSTGRKVRAFVGLYWRRCIISSYCVLLEKMFYLMLNSRPFKLDFGYTGKKIYSFMS